MSRLRKGIDNQSVILMLHDFQLDIYYYFKDLLIMSIAEKKTKNIIDK